LAFSQSAIAASGAAMPWLPLTSHVPVYLTGFQESRIRPESQKITQKVAGKKYDDSPFTLFAFTIVMVDFLLQAAPTAAINEKLAHELHLSY
jgi:hypothetical protein